METDSKPTMCISAREISLEPRSRFLVAAFVAVEVGGILLRVTVRRYRTGEVGVEFPTCAYGDSCMAAVELPAALKAEVEQEVLALFDAREAQENDQIL